MDLSGSSEVSTADVSDDASTEAPPSKAKAAKAAARHRFEIGEAAGLSGRGRSCARRPAHRFRQGHAGGPLSAARREPIQDLFARVASAYADDAAHAQRLYDYISKLWFMPATPVLSNGGTGRGLPISCFLNTVADSLEGIVGTWNENVWLAAHGGGIGTYWGNVRGIGETVGLNGKTSGIIPFVRVMDSPDAGDQPGLAAPRLGRLLSRHLAPGDRGVPRDPQAVGRLQPQGAEPAPRRARHRRVHGGGARRRANGCCRAPRTARSAARVDARSLFQKLVETRLRPASPTSSSSTR